MINVDKLYKAYGKHEVLKGLSLEINPPSTVTKQGLIFGFLGKNGAGKTTTMNILAGLAKFQSGNCNIKGILLNPNKRQYIEGLGYLPESPGMYSFMTGREYLRFIGSIKKLPERALRIKVDKMLELTGLKEAAKRKIGGYSKGMRQRMGMAAVMLHKPDLLFLDEPTSALDPEGRLAILDLLLHLRDKGHIIILSTHILNDAERVCDEIGILHNGKLMLQERIKVLMSEQRNHIYEIEFSEKPDMDIIQGLQSLEGITKIESDNNSLTVWVNNITVSKVLLRELNYLPYQIDSFRKRKANLEDIFISTLELELTK